MLKQVQHDKRFLFEKNRTVLLTNSIIPPTKNAQFSLGILKTIALKQL
jgi:hypothetical protein